MKDSHILLIVAVLCVIIGVLAFFVFFYAPPQEYKYSSQEKGVFFLSDYKEPAQYLQELKLEKTFIIAPEFRENNPTNSFMASSIVMFASILSANDKNIVSLARFVESGNLLYCQTNWGDPKTNIEITAEECSKVLSDTESQVVVLVSYPNNSLSNPKIVLLENKIEAFPKAAQDVQLSSYLILKAMYKNSDEIINQLNALAAQLRN